jgi:predicted transcriptional regulator
MSNKKSNIMSLSVDPEIQERLKKVAKKRNVSVSKLVRDMVDKNLSTTDEDVDTVIFKIPKGVQVSADELKKWLTLRVDAVVKALVH